MRVTEVGHRPPPHRQAEEYFREWGNEGEVEIRKVFSELIIMTASSCLMGPEIRENLSSEIARIYHALDGGLTPLSTLWPAAPTQKHKERDEARAPPKPDASRGAGPATCGRTEGRGGGGRTAPPPRGWVLPSAIGCSATDWAARGLGAR